MGVPVPRQLGLASLAVALPLLAACGASNTGGGVAAPAAFCQKVGAILSDGPDPDSDPVGYALSQILPLSQVKAPDHALSDTLDQLVAADHSLVASSGQDSAAAAAIKKTDGALNRACPGVSS
jgi:hypothetical protein